MRDLLGSVKFVDAEEVGHVSGGRALEPRREGPDHEGEGKSLSPAQGVRRPVSAVYASLDGVPSASSAHTSGSGLPVCA